LEEALDMSSDRILNDDDDDDDELLRAEIEFYPLCTKHDYDMQKIYITFIVFIDF